MLLVKDLMVFYENALALDSFNLELNTGEIRGVIGSNSSGKTTLMLALSGLLLDMKIKEQRRGGERISIFGEIIYEGQVITGLKPAERVRRGIVLCRERHPVFQESDVLENLKIAGSRRPRGGFKKSLELVFDLFPPLVSLRRRPAGFLSGGEQQMLIIGMALSAAPKLLLLDEPLLGLPPFMQKRLMETIQRIRHELEISVLVCEQYARPVLPVLDWAYVLENGMMTLAGPAERLMANPEVRSAYFGL
ncbi:MAG: ATP-binding cassette domain-containing protein [Thermodesulfobacteriota bacterium]